MLLRFVCCACAAMFAVSAGCANEERVQPDAASSGESEFDGGTPHEADRDVGHYTTDCVFFEPDGDEIDVGYYPHDAYSTGCTDAGGGFDAGYYPEDVDCEDIWEHSDVAQGDVFESIDIGSYDAEPSPDAEDEGWPEYDEELLDCQLSGSRCDSPVDPEYVCCPMNEPTCDGWQVGGHTRRDENRCWSISDAAPVGELLIDEMGCFYWETTGESCLGGGEDAGPDGTPDAG